MRPSRAVLCCMLAVPLALAGCRESEQGRVLLFEKGTYLGKPDTQLSEETRQALRGRSEFQRETVTKRGPGGGPLALGAPGTVLGVRVQGQGQPVVGTLLDARTGVPPAAREALRTRIRRQQF